MAKHDDTQSEPIETVAGLQGCHSSAPPPYGPRDQYGIRVEGDGSWTLYHVRTGMPACLDGLAMAGLNPEQATSRMLYFNRHKARHHDARLMPGPVLSWKAT